jgi:DNA repair photolyase
MPFRWTQVGQGPQGALFADEDLVDRHVGTGEFRGLEFFHVDARRIVNEIPKAARLPFRHTINPYRGCSHACTYCFARPTHAYLDFDTGDDFDRKIVVKVNAVERARAELHPARRMAQGIDAIALGTNTDPYQRCEGKYHLTQGLIDVFADTGTPFSILTKSTLILRDLDRLVAAAARVPVRCNLSIGTLDADVWRVTEPGTPPPWKRVEAVARLNRAGIPCGVLMMPIVPGLSDDDAQLQATVDACVGAGAVSIGAGYLHLRPGVREHFFARLRPHRPELVAAYETRYGDGRAYLPGADERALSARVGRLVDEARAARRLAGDIGPRHVSRQAARDELSPVPRRSGEASPSSLQLDLWG